METKTHWKKAFNSEYLGAVDLPDYKDMNLTIREVKLETAKTKEKEKCNIAYFVENVKPMILNVGNSKIVKKLSGGSRFINDWKNVKITLFVQTGVKAFGTETDALRIRPVTKATTKPTLDPKSKKWNMAKQKVKEGMTFEQLSKHYNITEANFKLLK